MSLTPINKAAYEIFSKMDEDEAKLILSALVYETLPSYIEEQTPLIQKHVDAWVSKRFNAYERYLKRQYVARVQKNEDTSDLEQAYEAISKAAPDYDPQRTPRGGDTENRGRFSRSWGPGANVAAPYGAKPGREITINFTRPLTSKPIKNPKTAGLPEKLVATGSKDYARMASLQASYMQLKNQLEEYDRAGIGGDVKIQLMGNKGTQIIAGTDIDTAFEELATASNKLPYKAIISVPYTTVGGTYFDALSSIPGMDERPDLTLNTMGAARGLPGNINAQSDFSQGWFDGSYALSDNEPRFRRLKSGAELVDTFVPASAMKTKAALTGAKYVGELGPDAEKIIGPTARKLTYRSRGTERKVIDPALSVIDASDRSRAIIGYSQPVMRRGEMKASGSPGTLVSYFADKLPKKDYWELQRKSGAIPPSEGVVIDSAGQIVSQSVGFKDDHYLPFNLKALSKLRGGEYVRTRSTGGPTTEDVYTALVGGASAFTVVSRSGTFTVEFDPTFTGRRRYNDKSGKMVERYGKLLDAAGSGEVTLNQIDGARYAEIVELARQQAPTDPKAFEARKNQLLEREKVMPSPAKGDEHEIKREIRADLRDEIANGGTPFATEYAESRQSAAKNVAANRRLAQQFNMEWNEPDPAVAEGQLAQMVEDEVSRRYPVAEKKAMEARSYKAMRLDGEGYHAALQSLKEQYPYYIASVRFIPGNQERDKGYVKPRFLRPDEVWDGYFDSDIKGKAPNTKLADQMSRHSEGEHGKIRASGTNYQNFRNKTAVADIDRDDVNAAKEKTMAGTTSDGIKTPTGTLKRVAISAEDKAIIDAVEASMKMKVKAVNGEGMAPVRPGIEAAKKEFGELGWNELGGIDADDVRGELQPILRDPVRRKNLVNSLKQMGQWANSTTGDENFDQFKSSVKRLRTYTATKAPYDADEAINSPSKVFTFDGISNADEMKLRDVSETLKPVMAEISREPEGDTPEEKLKHFLSRQQTRHDDALKNTPAGEPESPDVADALKKTMQGHQVKAMLVRMQELKDEGRLTNLDLFVGGPKPSETTIRRTAISP